MAERSERAESVNEAKDQAKVQGAPGEAFEGKVIGSCHVISSGGKRYLACDAELMLELLHGAAATPEVPEFIKAAAAAPDSATATH